MKIRLLVPLITLAICMLPWAAHSKVAKVSCGNLSGLSIENLICQDPELSRLDQLLGEVLSTSPSEANTAEENRVELVAAQQSWREARNECWRAEDPRKCALSQYEKRIVELQVGLGQVTAEQQGQFVCEGAGRAAEGLSLSFYRAGVPAVLAEFRGQRLLLIGERATSDGAFRAGDLTLTRGAGEITLEWHERAQAMRCLDSHWYSMGEPHKAQFVDCYPP